MQKQRRVKNFSPPSRPQESALKARIRIQNIAGGTCRQTKNSPQPDNEKRSRARMHSAGALKLPPHSPQPFNARPLQNKNILNAPRPRGDGRQNFRETPRRSWDAGYSAPSTPLNPAKLLLNLPQITSVIFPLRISAQFLPAASQGIFFVAFICRIYVIRCR